VADVTAKDACLFLWATAPKMEDAFQVLKAWGFRFSTIAFVWAKQNPNGMSFKCGMGYWTRSSTEFVLLGVKGKPKRLSKRVRQLVVEPIGAHSVKPAEVRRRIVELVGDLPRLEMFARQRAEGWEAVGDGVTGRDIREDLRLLAEKAQP
jgi:N6-adenosine-specific RNA methylase IME4